MERDGKEFIIHWIFVGDMKRVPMAKHGLEKCSRVQDVPLSGCFACINCTIDVLDGSS